MIDVFKVGVHVGMSSNAPQVLQAMLRHLTGVQTGIGHINAGFTRMAVLAGGAVAAFAGVKALEGIWHVVDASKKLNDELTRTKQLGGDFASSIGAARAAAFRTSADVGTLAPSEAVRLQRELGTQVQHPQAAIDILPQAARTAAVVSQYTGEDQESIIKNLIKVIDLRAKLFSKGKDGKEYIDQAKLGPELEAAAKGLILGGNYLKSGDLLALARQGGVPVKTIETAEFYSKVVEMAVSQGASRTGTALTSLFGQLVGGIMPLRVAQEMQKMDMLHPGEWKSARGGRVILGDKAQHRFEDALKDPISFITGPLNDMMTKKGMNQEQKIAEVYRLFGRQTTQRLVAEALSAGPQFERARGMFGNIPGVQDQFAMLQKENLSTNITMFTKAWQGFIEALGDAAIPSAITLLQHLTSALHTLTAAVEAHPAAAAHLLELATALSALVAIGGTITVFAVALGAIVGPLRTLAGIAGLATAGAALGGIAAGLTALGAALVGLPPLLRNGLEWAFGVQEKTPGAPGIVPGTSGGGRGSTHGNQTERPEKHSAVYLDGKKVGMIVREHLADDFSRPMTGGRGSDSRLTPVMPGMATAFG